MLALTAWHWDHQSGHVYALTLPLARWEYAMVKMAAGTIRTTVWFVSGVISFFIVVDILNDALALFIPYFQDVSIVAVVGQWLVPSGCSPATGR